MNTILKSDRNYPAHGFVKYGLNMIIFTVFFCCSATAQGNQNRGDLNAQIDQLIEKLETGAELDESEINRLGRLHYERGLAYKAIYLFSLDASLRAIENLESNYSVTTEGYYSDLIKLRKHLFLNNRNRVEELLQKNQGNEYFAMWGETDPIGTEISTKDQIVAGWYMNPEFDPECASVSDSEVRQFCELFSFRISDFSHYLKGEQAIREFLPVLRRDLIQYEHTDLIGYVDYFHAHWLYDFSRSNWLLEKIDSDQRVNPLFELRKWNALSAIDEPMANPRKAIMREIAAVLSDDSSISGSDLYKKLVDYEAQNERTRWIFTVRSLLEAAGSECVRELLLQEDFERILTQGGSGMANRIAELLIRTEKIYSSRNFTSRYLPQSGSYDIGSYGAHRLVLAAHFNFLVGGIGGENVSKAQLNEFQQHFPNTMPLYLLVQIATERGMESPNDLIQTN